MAKKPNDCPEVGDRVEMRGHPQRRGTLVQVDTDDNWSHVKWDHAGLVLVHLFELKKIKADLTSEAIEARAALDAVFKK